MRNTRFTIVASNCIGARIYQELGLEYNTPFVGLFIYAPCYIKLLTDFESFLKSPMRFVEGSKYGNVCGGSDEVRRYPIGLLGGEIEIHFQHYDNALEAESKWDRRVQRMDMNNLFFIFTDRDLCDRTMLERFDRMPFQRKVCFTAREYPTLNSSVLIREYSGQPCVGDMYTEFHVLRRHFDFVDWLKGGTGITRR